MVSEEKPRLSADPSETCEFGKCMFYWCKKSGIPTIGIQHGVLNDLRCIHTKNEIGTENPNHCQIPTMTAVYGTADKEFLIKKGNYPEKSVIVTGNQRYDILAKADKLFDKKRICKELKLEPNKKIITVTTQVFPSIKDRELLTQIVKDALKNSPDIQLIIKVHPTETTEFYNRIIGNNKKTILTKYDIFKVLYISDALITVCSTAGLEAAILEKPIIVVKSIEDSQLTDYSEKGIALEAYNAKELQEAIEKVLYDKKTRERLAKNRKNTSTNTAIRQTEKHQKE